MRRSATAFASPNSSAHFGSRDRSLSIPEKPGRMLRLMTMMFAALSTSMIGMPKIGLPGVLRADATAACGSEGAEEHVPDRAIHRFAHELCEDHARRADQHAGDDEEHLAEHEPREGDGDAAVRVEERDDRRHVRAADGQHE